MKKQLTLGILLIGLSGCVHFHEHVRESQPLNNVLTAVKQEIRNFNAEIENSGTYEFQCDSNRYAVKDYLNVSDIEVTIAVENMKDKYQNRREDGSYRSSEEVEIGASVMLNRSLSHSRRNKNNSDTLVLNLAPSAIAELSPRPITEGGIAQSLAAVMRQLAQVDAGGLCLEAGKDSSLTLNFGVEPTDQNENGVNLVVFNSNSLEPNKIHHNLNEIKISFNMGGVGSYGNY